MPDPRTATANTCRDIRGSRLAPAEFLPTNPERPSPLLAYMRGDHLRHAALPVKIGGGSLFQILAVAQQRGQFLVQAAPISGKSPPGQTLRIAKAQHHLPFAARAKSRNELDADKPGAAAVAAVMRACHEENAGRASSRMRRTVAMADGPFRRSSKPCAGRSTEFGMISVTSTKLTFHRHVSTANTLPKR